MFKLISNKWFWLGLLSGGIILHFLTRDDCCQDSELSCCQKDNEQAAKAS